MQAFGSFEAIDQHLERLLDQEDAVGLYDIMLERLEQSLSPTLQGNGTLSSDSKIKPLGAILGLITLVPSLGLSEDEIIRITKVPLVVWSSLFSQIGDHLTVSGARLMPGNGDFTAAVASRFLDSSEPTRQFCRNKLIEFFDNSANSRKFEAVPRILVHQNDMVTLAQFLSAVPNFAEMTKTPALKQELVHYWKLCQSTSQSSLFVERLLAEFQKVRPLFAHSPFLKLMAILCC
jgi:hypothetical protein